MVELGKWRREPMDTMEIRSYAPGDEEAVIALWQRCGLVVPQNDPRRDIERKLSVAPELFLVGTVEGRIVATAMAGYEGHRGVVNYLAVEPEFQKHGYGRELMTHLEDVLRERGCPKINLMIRTTNRAVIDFYERLGYSMDPVVCLGKRLIGD